MEKLQKAIAMARKDRKQGGPQDPQSRRTTAPEKPQGVAGAWDRLAEIHADAKHLTRRRVVSHESSESTTAFDVLRTKVMQQMQQNGWKRLMITSPMPECGKTTLAANLAYGIVRQGEKSAILLEMDLRKPNLGALIGFKPEHDIRDMLMGELPFHEQAQLLGENVAVSMANKSSSDPNRFLTSQSTATVLDEIERDYAPDLMIFDMPPLLVNDDARSFLPMVDCVLLVARAEKSTTKQLDVCEREIAEHTNVVGIVLNHCRFADETQGYNFEQY